MLGFSLYKSLNWGEISMRYAVILLGLLISAASVRAQHHSAPAPAAGKVTLLSGLGNLHHPIATNNPEAQKFFDQGLTLIFGFNHDTAITMFQRAAELDPNAAMPQWGTALALGSNYNDPGNEARFARAYQALQQAQSLVANGAENERAYVAALARRYSSDPKADRKKLDSDYEQAMAGLVRRYPDDLDAATLYAESLMNLRPWQLWTPDGTPAEGTEQIIAVLEGVMKRDPNHPGANHYYIHAVEASPNPARALASAQRLETLVPAAGHLVHMPFHIYFQTGYYDIAARVNAAGAAADEAYVQASGDQGIYRFMYLSHNYHCLAASSSMAGNFAEAQKAAERLIANVAPAAKDMPMAAAFQPVREYVLLRFNRWDDILKLPAPQPSTSVAVSFWHFARAIAFAAKDQMSEATQESAAYTVERKKVPAGFHFGFNSEKAVYEVADEVLAARMAAARGDRKGAIAAWRKAVAVQDTLSYGEPPDWYYPVRESLGAALLADGQAAEAEAVFRADLSRNPRSGRSLFGLWQSLLAQNKTADAGWVQRQFEAAWKNADVKLRVEDL